MIEPSENMCSPVYFCVGAGGERNKGPLGELLEEVVSVIEKSDSKKKVKKEIQMLFKKKEPSILSTTLSLWYKKYEKESHEKSKTQILLDKTIEVNKILAAQVTRGSSQNLTPTNGGNNTSIEGFSRYISNSEEHPPRLIKSRTSPVLELDSKQERCASVELTEEDSRQCPLCSKKLHAVYSELEEKKEKIQTLNEMIQKMTHRGQIMISQSNLYVAENSRLESHNQDLQEMIKVLEKLIAKLSSESQCNIKRFLATIEEQRLEIERLKELLLRSPVALNSGKIPKPKNSKLSHQEKETEPPFKTERISSIPMKRLAAKDGRPDQNTPGFNIVKQPSADQQMNISFFSEGEKKLSAIPSSGLFSDELSKIQDQGIRRDTLSSEEKDGLLYILENCGSRVSINDKITFGQEKESSASEDLQKSSKEKNIARKNLEVQSRTQYAAACRLI